MGQGNAVYLAGVSIRREDLKQGGSASQAFSVLTRTSPAAGCVPNFASGLLSDHSIAKAIRFLLLWSPTGLGS